MLNEILQSIAEAEKRAEDIAADARITAKDIAAKATEKSLCTAKQNKAELKSLVKTAQDDAALIAEEKTLKIMERAKSRALAYEKQAELNCNKAVELIKAKILEIYGNS